MPTPRKHKKLFFTIFHGGKYYILFKSKVAWTQGAQECTVIMMQNGNKYMVSGNIGYWKKHINDTGALIDAHKSWCFNPEFVLHMNLPQGVVMDEKAKKDFEIGKKKLKMILKKCNYIPPPPKNKQSQAA